jgi:hypothetical protein
MTSYNQAEREALEAMKVAAADQRTMTYGDLAGLITVVRLDPNSDALFQILDKISTAEDVAGRGMLSAVVIRVDTSVPGEGFFKLAKRLGPNTSDELRFHVEELKNVFAANAR